MDIYGNISYSSAIVEHRVDRTPPSAPSGLSVENKDYAVIVTWPRGDEIDIQSYSIYRSTSEDGTYIRLNSGLKTLGYADKNVSAGTTYYYKATATDQAGNEGPRSEAVSGMLLADTEPPIINSIGPRHNSSVGINPTISVLAQGRLGLNHGAVSTG